MTTYNLPISYNSVDYNINDLNVFSTANPPVYQVTRPIPFNKLTVNFTNSPNSITMTPTQNTSYTFVLPDNTPINYLESNLYQVITSPTINVNQIFVFKGNFQNSWNSLSQSLTYPLKTVAFIQALTSGFSTITSTTSPINTSGNFTLTLDTTTLSNVARIHWGIQTSGQAVYNYSPTLYGSVLLTNFVEPYPCFKEDTKILTDQGYKLIQDLRKGDLVKTLLHGFKPIDLIGKRDIFHSASKERVKEQLYKCSKDHFVEVFEPLILTGCHSILVDEFVSQEQREKSIEINNGRLFITDNKYRLPACVDLRTQVYEIEGTYTIYHLALENNDYLMNYGIYANGLLVESCSKRYLKELSNMELIE